MDREGFSWKMWYALSGIYLNMLANRAMHWETSAVEGAMDAIRNRPVEDPAETVDALSRILGNASWIATREERVAIQVGIHMLTWQVRQASLGQRSPHSVRLAAVLPQERDRAA
jgi:hypothetical protein